MNHIDRLTVVTRRQQEMIRDAAAERVSASAAKRDRTHPRLIGRLVGLRVALAA